MKKVLYIVAAAAALAFTSCNAEAPIEIETYGGQGLTFLHFLSPSDSWLVGADDESYVYDVVVAQTKKYSEDKTYDLLLGDGTTGKEGVDFKMATKSVTIPAGEYAASFPVEVLYATTGEGFSIEFVLNVDETLFNPTYGDSQYVVVKTDKITIDWDWLAGKWNATEVCYYDGSSDEYPMQITKVDETTCSITNLWGAGSTIDGCKVDFDARTITIPTYVEFADLSNYGAAGYLVAVDPEADFDLYYDDDDEPIFDYPLVAKMSPLGVVIDNWDVLMVGGDYDGYTYGGGYCTTLTR